MHKDEDNLFIRDMYLHGEFINKRGAVVALHILTNGDYEDERIIGSEETGVFFPTEDPIMIENEVNDTFDVLLRQSAKVTLLCRNYIPELFCTSARSAVVNVYEGGRCVFAGFIEPMTYSQPYNETYDELELNCLDALSGLQYMNYKSVGALGVVYEVVRGEASTRTFGDVVMEALRSVSAGLDVLSVVSAGDEAEAESHLGVWYDGSRGADEESCNGASVFSDMGVTDILFMGSSADEVWTTETVVEEVLKYLNLHIRQEGFEFYIFAWETVREGNGEPLTWYAVDGEGNKVTERNGTIAVSLDNVADCGTSISIGEVYNQLMLTAVVEAQENVVENPLDSGSLTSPYDGMQKYMTEYAVNIDGLKKEWKRNTDAIGAPYYYDWVEGDKNISTGEGIDKSQTGVSWIDTQTNSEASYNAFASWMMDWAPNYKNAYMTDWYLRLKQHAHWKFPMGNWTPITGKTPLSAEEDLVAYAKRNGCGQDEVMTWLDGTTGRGCIAAFGSQERCMADSNNSSKPSMEDRMVISVGGTLGVESQPQYDYTLSEYKRIVNAMKASRPCAVYESVSAGGVFSPSDEAITNYIVLSGKISLNPVRPTYTYMKNVKQSINGHTKWNYDDNFNFARPMPNTSVEYTDNIFGQRTAVDGVTYKLYTQRYWHTVDPLQDPTEDSAATGLSPMTGNAQTSQSYNAVAGSLMNEYPVLSCMLIIGDKCVVETGVLGVSPSYEWRTYKTREECGSDDEYYRQCFYISFLPKGGEHALGEEHDLMNNVTLQTGIDAEGTAIPMKASDHLSGVAKFVIIGPAPISSNFAKWDIYDDFNDTSYLFLGSPLLFMRSIELKNFEIKLYSDSGHFDGGDNDKDVVYLSDTKEKFVNRKEDIEMKINSALTAAECRRLGVSSVVKSSTPLNLKTSSGVLTIYDRYTDEEAKAEHLYVDNYWREYHKPRILMDQTLEDDGRDMIWLNRYRHPAMGKEFYVQGSGRDLMEGTITLTLKEKFEETAS